MITSTGNNRIRAVSALVKKAKARREQKLFIAEGPKLFSELPRTHLRETYVSESFLKLRAERADALLKGCSYEIVSDEVMRYLSDTQTPQGILAVAEQFSYTLSDLTAEPAHLRQEGPRQLSHQRSRRPHLPGPLFPGSGAPGCSLLPPPDRRGRRHPLAQPLRRPL